MPSKHDRSTADSTLVHRCRLWPSTIQHCTVLSVGGGLSTEYKLTQVQCLLNVGPASPVLASIYSALVSTSCWWKCVYILPESTPPSQDPPPFRDFVGCLRIPESTPPSQNIPPFSTTICDTPRIYPPFQNIPPFSTTIILCDPSRIYPSLLEYTPLFNNYKIMPRSQNLPLPPRINPLFNHPSLPEYTPIFNSYMWYSQNLPLLIFPIMVFYPRPMRGSACHMTRSPPSFSCYLN